MPCERPTASGGECGRTTTNRPPDCGQHGPAPELHGLTTDALGRKPWVIGGQSPPPQPLLGLTMDASGRESPAERYAVFNEDGLLVAAYEDLDEAIDGVKVCLGAGSVVDTDTDREAWRSTAEDEAAFVPPFETGNAVYFNDGKVLRLGSGGRR